jgi:hypothetical protein
MNTYTDECDDGNDDVSEFQNLAPAVGRWRKLFRFRQAFGFGRCRLHRLNLPPEPVTTHRLLPLANPVLPRPKNDYFTAS